MPTALRYISVIFLFSAILILDADSCSAQQVNCGASFEFDGSREFKLITLFQDFSEAQKTSLIAEVPYDSTKIEISPGTYSLVELATKFDHELHCEVIDGVLHFFDDKVISLNGNALNHQFTAFEMPPNVDRFRILLTGRLQDEAFAPPQSGKSVIKERGGGLSWNAERFPLREGTYRDVRARDLLFAVARERILSSVICFPNPEKASTDPDVWKFAAAHWYWDVSDPSGPSK